MKHADDIHGKCVPLLGSSTFPFSLSLIKSTPQLHTCRERLTSSLQTILTHIYLPPVSHWRDKNGTCHRMGRCAKKLYQNLSFVVTCRSQFYWMILKNETYKRCHTPLSAVLIKCPTEKETQHILSSSLP